MKTALLSSIACDGLHSELSRFGDVCTATGEHDIAAAIDGADALVMSNPGLYTAAFAAKLRAGGAALKWIQFLSAGYDGPKAHGIPAGCVLTNGGDCWSPTVAEHGVALLLSLARRLPQSFQAQLDRKWDAGIRPTLGSLEGMTVAILGFGSVGRELAARLRPFGTRIIGVTRRGSAAPGDGADRIIAFSGLDGCLGDIDALFITVPLSDETRHIVGAGVIAKMPPRAVLINLSRGGTLDGEALEKALVEGRLAGAALDVTDPEPLPSSDPLWAAPNLIVTPHIAGFGSPALDARLIRLVGENARRFASGEALLHQVDVPTV